MLLLPVTAPGSEDHGVEIGVRAIGGDAIHGWRVRFWWRCRRCGLLGHLHRLRGSRLTIGRLRSAACCRGLGLIGPPRLGRRHRLARTRGLIWLGRRILLGLLNRCDWLRGDGLNRLRCGNIRWCGRRLSWPEQLRVKVGGRPIAGHAVHGLVRLLGLSGRLRRRRIVCRRAAGNGDRDRGERSGDPDARQCAVQAVPPDRVSGRSSSNKARIWRLQGKAVPRGPAPRAKMARGPARYRRTPHLSASAGL
jgi:hypothetical protein